MTPSDPRRGIVLVAVLWTIALLSALAMAAATTFRGYAGLMAIDRDRVQAQALLTAGLETAAGVAVKIGEGPLADMNLSVTLSTGTVTAQLSDESGRIDIGKVPVEVLASLFHSVGIEDADGLAKAVDHWRDPDGTLAKANAAAAAATPAPGTGPKAGAGNPPNPPQNAAPANPPNAPPAAGAAGNQPAPGANQNKTETAPPFTDIRQLANVPTMQPEWIAAVAPLVTVFGGKAVDPFTASAAVMAALPGLDRSSVAAFLAARLTLSADPQQLMQILGPAARYVAPGGQHVISVTLAATLKDGFGAGAQVMIRATPQDQLPYRILAWNPLTTRVTR